MIVFNDRQPENILLSYKPCSLEKQIAASSLYAIIEHLAL